MMRLPDPPTPDSLAALRAGRHDRGGDRHAGPELASTPEGQVTVTLSPVALHDRAAAAMQQSIEIVRRRIDATGVVDPQVTQQGEVRIVVQFRGSSDPERIKELLGKTAHMTFQLVDENGQSGRGGAAARRASSCRCRTAERKRSRWSSGWMSMAAT